MTDLEKTQQSLKEAIEHLQKIQGDVKAFIILAVSDKKIEERKGVGLNASAGGLGDLANLYRNISPDIVKAAAMGNLLDMFLTGLDKVESK